MTDLLQKKHCLNHCAMTRTTDRMDYYVIIGDSLR